MGLWDRMRRQLSFDARMKHEQTVAVQASEALLPILRSLERSGFPYGPDHSAAHRDRMIGFVFGACDVAAQSLQGRARGHGAVNATLKCLESLCGGDSGVSLLMENTLALLVAPTPEFLRGRRAGANFANAMLRGDRDEMVLVSALVFAFD